MTIYTLLITACWLAFLLVWLFSAFSAKRNLHRSTAGMIVRILIVIGILVLFHGAIFSTSSSEALMATTNPVVSTIGVILAVLGIALAIWARLNLGKNWGMPMSVKENPELVTTGPYRYVRHPIYTGALTAILGSALTTGLGWLIVFGLCAVYFIYAATQEEKLMVKEFPNQYSEYKKQTKMLIPFIF